MNFKWIFIVICIILLPLSGCNTSDGDNNEDYKQLAAGVLAEKVIADPKGGLSVPGYVYQWSDNPATDILYMNTMRNKDKNLICEQFYATDGVNVWRGGVMIDALKHEIVDTYSYHIFTSGVTRS